VDHSRYRIVSIPKRSGGVRILEIPDALLMQEQRRILGWLYARKVAPSPYAHGFVRGRSIVTNARLHVGKRVVIRIDIKDFFPSVTAVMVREALITNGISAVDATAITEICTLDGRLPQGGPASPFLSNLVAMRLDYRLAGLARHWRDGKCSTSYSRYADDLAFSSDDRHLNHLVPAATRIIRDCGFAVHENKTRVYRRSARQILAGVVVNAKPNVPRTVRRNLRAELHQAREALVRGDVPTTDLRRLRGLAAHIRAVNAVAGVSLLRDVDEVERLQLARSAVQK